MNPTQDPRETMAQLPSFVQPFLTWLTGKALPGQQPLFRHTPFTQLAAGLLMLFGGSAASFAFATMSPWLWMLLPLSMITTIAGARFLQTNIYHQASHNRFIGKPSRQNPSGASRFDHWLGEAISLLLILAPIDKYRESHRKHHFDDFGSFNDPDFRFFRRFGFEPGSPMSDLRRALWLGLLRPTTHIQYLRARLQDNLLSRATWQRRLAILAIHGSALAWSAATSHLTAFLLAWLLSVTIGFQLSGLLQFLTEHVWLLPQEPGESKIRFFSRMTLARFQGEPMPTPYTLAWFAWAGRMLTIHLFWRVFAVQGPLVVHDYHHNDPLDEGWPMAVYTRQAQIDSGAKRYSDYTGIWGFLNSLERSLQAIHDAPKQPAQPALTQHELRDLFRVM